MKYLILFLLFMGVSYSQIGFTQPATAVSDTNSLKTMNVGDGGAMFIGGYTKDTATGAGWYIVIDSTYAEGVIAFDHPTRGKQWASTAHINNIATSAQMIKDTSSVIVKDSLNNSANVVKYYSDTTALKAETGTNVKQVHVVSLNADFVYKASGYTPDGGTVFAHATSGYWVLKDRLNKKRAVPAWFGNFGDTADDQPYLQKTLDLAGDVYWPKPADGQYIINLPLRIKSNTRLTIESGTEIFLKAAADTYMVRNYNFPSADSNITILGGDGVVFNGNDANQTLPGTPYPAYQGHGFMLHNITNYTIKDVLFKDILRFAHIISNSERIRAENLGFDTEKDGFDLPACKDVVIKNFYGHTGDDMVGLFSGGYQSLYEVGGTYDYGVRGTSNILIDGIMAFDVDITDANAYGALTGVNIGGAGTGGAFRHSNITIRNVKGNFSQQAFRTYTMLAGSIYWVPGTQYTYIENFLIEDFLCETSGSIVKFTAPYADNGLIRNIRSYGEKKDQVTIQLGDSVSGSTYNDIRVEDIFSDDSLASLINICDANGATTFNRLILDDFSARNHTGYMITINGAPTFNNYFKIKNIVADNIGVLNTATANITFNCPVSINNYLFKDFGIPIQLRSSMTLDLNNGVYDNCTYISQFVNNVNYRITGSGIKYRNYLPTLTLSGSPLFTVNNPDIRVATNTMFTDSLQDGDRAYSISTSTNSTTETVVRWDDTESRWNDVGNKYRWYSTSNVNLTAVAGDIAVITLTFPFIYSLTEDMITVTPPNDMSVYWNWWFKSLTNTQIRVYLKNESASTINETPSGTWRVKVEDRP